MGDTGCGEMERTSFLRLLRVTALVLVLGAAFAGTASAGLPGLGGGTQAAPVDAGGTVDDALGAVTSTTSDVVGEATGTTNEIVDDVASTASETTTEAAATVHATTTEVEATVSDVVEEKVEPAETAVPPAASEVVRRPSPPPVSASSTAETTPPATAAGVRSAATGEATAHATPPPSEIVRAVAPSRPSPVARAISSRARPGEAVLRAPRLRATTSPSAHASVVPAKRPALAVPRAPADPPMPVTFVLGVLFSPAGASGPPILAALLGLLALAHLFGPGRRRRPLLDVVRPPDVLFPLERPG